MLQTKDLVKVYRPKKGVPVTALNKVSITFPEKGMVFLLGKSGSGKSTLLNVLGGLDDYNGGEIIIKGVSSKYFRRNHFDSYRNTYVGFIFQEYHVLDELTVGANIGLAIELQNRKATDAEINAILKEVDLDGYGNRKPNELSGGQKQRVAIARALIKKPEIIMADEPTGALDSNTGRQILETLKKLSKEKLVIVVSHDREFAEIYGDRIIELADGEVISDVELKSEEISEEEIGILCSGNTVEIPEGYHLTEDDRKMINDHLAELESGDSTIEIKAASRMSNRFAPTDVSKIKLQDGSSFRPIKAKLPFKSATRMGLRGLSYKKFGLALTILLSCISFALFGIADTLGSFTDAQCRTNTLYDNDFSFVAVSKAKYLGEGEDAYWQEEETKLSQKNFNEIEKHTGVKMHGVFVDDGDFSYSSNTTDTYMTETEFDIYPKKFTGFAEINKEVLESLGFKILAGELPDGRKDEIAVSEFVFDIFDACNYTNSELFYYTDSGEKKPDSRSVNKPEHLVGKVLDLNGKKYTITAVIDTGFNLDRYTDLTIAKEKVTEAEKEKNDALFAEFETAFNYSFAGVMMVGDGYVDNLVGGTPKLNKPIYGEVRINNDSSATINGHQVRDCFSFDVEYFTRFADLDTSNVVWVDGERTKLGEKELIVSTDILLDKNKVWDRPADSDLEGWAEIIADNNSFLVWKNFKANESDNEFMDEGGYKIVGIFEPTYELYNTVVCHDNLYHEFVDEGDNFYNFAVGSMPESKGQIKTLVDFCYKNGDYEDKDVQFWIRNSATWNLDKISEQLMEYRNYAFIIALAFAGYAIIMLTNFITGSITHKKEEIGILRAIGSKGSDVFSIFFVESFVIAVTNFILATIIVGIATSVINDIIRSTELITALNFGVRQGVLILLVSAVVAFLASYFPVKKVASMKPIDAIRNR